MAKGQLMQATDHDFSKISLVPTVILVHDLLKTLDGS